MRGCSQSVHTDVIKCVWESCVPNPNTSCDLQVAWGNMCPSSLTVQGAPANKGAGQAGLIKQQLGQAW